MPNKHPTLVHEWFEEVWNRRDVEAIDRLLTAETIVHGITDEQGMELCGPEVMGHPEEKCCWQSSANFRLHCTERTCRRGSSRNDKTYFVASNSAMLAVKPCMKFCLPMGPSSPWAKKPARGIFPRAFSAADRHGDFWRCPRISPPLILQ